MKQSYSGFQQGYFPKLKTYTRHNETKLTKERAASHNTHHMQNYTKFHKSKQHNHAIIKSPAYHKRKEFSMNILSPYRDEGPSVKQYIDQRLNKIEKEQLLEIVRKKMASNKKMKIVSHKKNSSQFVPQFRESNYEKFLHLKVPINSFIKHKSPQKIHLQENLENFQNAYLLPQTQKNKARITSNMIQ